MSPPAATPPPSAKLSGCPPCSTRCARAARGSPPPPAGWRSTSSGSRRSSPAPPPELDPERHYLEGSPRARWRRYLLTLDAVNFGSGWFPTLRKRPGCSGYFTVAWALADRFREHGPWSNRGAARLRRRARWPRVLGQDADHELMAPLRRGAAPARRLPRRARTRWTAVDRGAAARPRRLAESLAEGMPFFDDAGFYKRAQIVPIDLALAGVAEFDDLDRLTIFADNLVPHVLRVDGVLRYDPGLAARIDARRAAARRASEETRDPRLRRARLRAHRQPLRRAAAHPRRLAVEPRPGAALQGDPAPPHAHRALLMALRATRRGGVRAAAQARRLHLGALGLAARELRHDAPRAR